MICQSASRRGLVFPAQIALIAFSFVIVLIVAPLAAAPAAAQSLYGSHESLVRQNLVAQQHDYAYLRTTQDVVQAVDGGVLVAVHGNDDFQLATGEVSFPYARPEVKTFLEQLSSAYHAACGEPLVVTSLVRPISRQPWNASPISVHPTGMAVDLRRSDRHGCRHWLESTLLALESEGMIEAIRERWPPHYHVAVFPDPLLLPGPIGDPNGVVRVAALAALHGGTLLDPEASFASADNETVARHGRVHLGRSARTGRFRITQTAVARRGWRGRQAGRSSATSATSATSANGAAIDIRRSRRAARHGQQQAHDSRKGRQPQAGAVANARSAAKHRSAARSHSRARSRASARTTTAAAR